jgi:hypothetical protein
MPISRAIHQTEAFLGEYFRIEYFLGGISGIRKLWIEGFLCGVALGGVYFVDDQAPVAIKQILSGGISGLESRERKL